MSRVRGRIAALSWRANPIRAGDSVRPDDALASPGMTDVRPPLVLVSLLWRGRLALSGCLALAGCAPGGPLATSPDAAVLAGDRYAMAHGMALAFMTSGRATGMDLLQVIHLDRAAMLSLAQGNISAEPSDALIDYVTRREIDGQPAPATVPPEFLRGLPPAAAGARPAPPPGVPKAGS